MVNPKFVSYVAEKHNGEYRRNGTTPYFAHCVRVMCNLIKYDICEQDLLHAALGHDLLEGTNATLAEIAGLTSQSTLNLIVTLTWSSRFQTSEEYILGMPTSAILVKMADTLDNLSESPTPKQIVKYRNYIKSFMQRKPTHNYGPVYILAHHQMLNEINTLCK